MNNKINIQDLLEESVKDSDPLINLFETKDKFTSSHFSKKEHFLKSLLNLEYSSASSYKAFESNDYTKITKELSSLGTDVTFIRNWKNIENISARLIELYEDIVVLECLIDRDKGEYEEREFRASLFSEYDVTIGNLFYLRFFERPGECRMEIHDDPKLTYQNDFQKVDFKELYSSSKLFKKNN